MLPQVPDDRISDPTQFVHWAADLTDEEAKQVVAVILGEVQEKYQYKLSTQANLEALRDEALTRMAEIGILAELDVSPVFNGEPPILEIIGKVSTDSFHKHGFDHEKKEWEVRKAKDRGEDYLGQKEPANKRREKKKDDGGT